MSEQDTNAKLQAMADLIVHEHRVNTKPPERRRIHFNYHTDAEVMLLLATTEHTFERIEEEMLGVLHVTYRCSVCMLYVCQRCAPLQRVSVDCIRDEHRHAATNYESGRGSYER